jgi:hypothetical protein
MASQSSKVPFGVDASVLAGYAYAANARLGNIDLTLENTGLNTLTFQLKEWDGVTAPSGYYSVGGVQTVVPGGVKTISYNIVAKRVGLFGSGGTTANVTFNFRNPADLRGAQIDLIVTGRRGWAWDDAFNRPELSRGFGPPPDAPNDPNEGY